MKRFLTFNLPLGLLTATFFFLISNQLIRSMENNQPAPLPAIPEGHETATFAAGCYWCVETVFQRQKGVHSATSGFMGGKEKNPSYEAVCQGKTGHTEVVQVVFDPKIISYEDLLGWFWRLHDPTQLNRQGADIGTQYRSAIFYHNDTQKKTAKASQVKAQESFSKPIVTEVTQATQFYPAQLSHQDYYRINGNKNPYCQAVIAPKLKKLNLE